MAASASGVVAHGTRRRTQVMRTSAGPPVRLNRNGVWTDPGNESPAQAIAPPKRTTNGMTLNRRRRRMAAGRSNYAASAQGAEGGAMGGAGRWRFDVGATSASGFGAPSTVL